MNQDEIVSLPVASAVEKFIENQTKDPEKMRGDLSALKLVPHFFSSAECEFFRKLVRKDSTERVQQLLNRKRLIFESEKVAEWFWNRLKEHNPFQTVRDEHGDYWKAVGINPRFRLVRYDEGDSFQTHQDGFYWQDWNRKTFATAMVYLNSMEEEDGGVTRFHDICTVVKPAQGLLVVFCVNDLIHCGERCKKEKYLLRTDIFYELIIPRFTCCSFEEEFNIKRKQLWDEYQKMCN